MTEVLMSAMFAIVSAHVGMNNRVSLQLRNLTVAFERDRGPKQVILLM
jgi:hypothetical protein